MGRAMQLSGFGDVLAPGSSFGLSAGNSRGLRHRSSSSASVSALCHASPEDLWALLTHYRFLELLRPLRSCCVRVMLLQQTDYVCYSWLVEQRVQSSQCRTSALHMPTSSILHPSHPETTKDVTPLGIINQPSTKRETSQSERFPSRIGNVSLHRSPTHVHLSFVRTWPMSGASARTCGKCDHPSIPGSTAYLEYHAPGCPAPAWLAARQRGENVARPVTLCLQLGVGCRRCVRLSNNFLLL